MIANRVVRAIGREVARPESAVILFDMENALQAERNRAARLRGERQALRNAMKASREAPITNLDSVAMQLPDDHHMPEQEPSSQRQLSNDC
jgi:hypothetical protein